MSENLSVRDLRVFSDNLGCPFRIGQEIVHRFGISAHELRKLRLFARYCVAGGNQYRDRERNLHGGNIENHLEAQPLGEQIVWRACNSGINSPSLESRDGLTDIT